MSSFGRTYLPVGLAIAFGIWNGYYAFNPALKDQQQMPQQAIARDGLQLDKTPDPENQQGPQKSSR